MVKEGTNSSLPGETGTGNMMMLVVASIVPLLKKTLRSIGPGLVWGNHKSSPYKCYATVVVAKVHEKET